MSAIEAVGGNEAKAKVAAKAVAQRNMRHPPKTGSKKAAVDAATQNVQHAHDRAKEQRSKVNKVLSSLRIV